MIKIISSQLIKGYLYGSNYPLLKISLSVENSDLPEQLDKADNLLSLIASKNTLKIKNNDPDAICKLLIQTIDAINFSAGWPIFQKCMILGYKKPNDYQVGIPCFVDRYHQTLQLINAIIKIFNSSLKNKNEGISNLLDIINKIKDTSLKDQNTKNFINAAIKLKIPFSPIQSSGLYQFGYCAESRLLHSSFTDKTPQISSAIARNKEISNQFLKRCGLPTPHHYLVNNIRSALERANFIKYPVVVKPMDLDGGNGVFANVSSDDELKKCYEKANILSKDILIEKHFFGKDYRLVVFENELIFAIERVPAHIVGDGHSSIKTLVELANEIRKKSPSLTQLKLDEDSLQNLKKLNLTQDSVPKKESIIFLRSIANINVGGTPVPVLDKVHKDNKALVINAAKFLGLDLAGVDLLIPDVSQSWKIPENHGIIIEVNAQPTLGSLTSSHLYPMLLRKLLPKLGKVPIVVFVGTNLNTILDDVRNKSMMTSIKTAVLSDEDNFKDYLGADVNLTMNLSAYEKGIAASMNKDLSAIVMGLDPDKIGKDGLAFNYIDMLVIVDEIGKQDKSRLWKNVEPLLPLVKKKIYLFDSNTEHINAKFKGYCMSKDIAFDEVKCENIAEEVLNFISSSVAL